LSFLLLGAFLGMAATVHAQVWRAIDWAALTWLQNRLPRSVDLPFSMLSLLGSVEITTAILLALVLLSPPRQRIPIIVAFGAMTLIEIIGKSSISQPIPPRELLRSVPFFWLLSGKLKTAYAFPSGHAARTIFLIAAAMTLVVASNWTARKKFVLNTLAILGAVVMLTSRVYLVEHWLSDVIGGALLGGAFAMLATVRRE
jgi:undecaprenyl-diphosphatase